MMIKPAFQFGLQNLSCQGHILVHEVNAVIFLSVFPVDVIDVAECFFSKRIDPPKPTAVSSITRFSWKTRRDAR